MTSLHSVPRSIGTFAAILAAASAVVFAGGAPEADGFGVNNVNYLWVQAPEFVCAIPGTGQLSFVADGFWYNSAAFNSIFFAPVQLPSGALVTGMTIVYDDQDSGTGADITVRLLRNSIALGSTSSSLIGSQYTSTGSPGLTVGFHDITPDHVISYYNPITFSTQSYVLYLGLPSSGQVSFQGVRIHWYLRVSPPPATATFIDVPTDHWAFDHIEALADAGITVGCAAGMYCPDLAITRAQMAVYLAKALGLSWPP